jgi:hypothetical protein
MGLLGFCKWDLKIPLDDQMQASFSLPLQPRHQEPENVRVHIKDIHYLPEVRSDGTGIVETIKYKNVSLSKLDPTPEYAVPIVLKCRGFHVIQVLSWYTNARLTDPSQVTFETFRVLVT